MTYRSLNGSVVYDDVCLTHLGMEDIPFFITITAPEFNEFSYFLAKYQPGKRKEAMAFLQKLYEEENGTGSVMPHRLIEDEIADIYADDARVARIFTTFAMLSLLMLLLTLATIWWQIRKAARENPADVMKSE